MIVVMKDLTLRGVVKEGAEMEGKDGFEGRVVLVVEREEGVGVCGWGVCRSE
jgi:hypothetical protein